MRHHRQNIIDSFGNYTYELIKEMALSMGEMKEIPVFCECSD